MVKKTIVITLISIYCLIIFRDFIPELIYKLNINYIIENLCEQKKETENLCMGHCFLNKKIDDLISEKKEPANSKNIPINIDIKNLETHFVIKQFLETNSQKYNLAEKLFCINIQLPFSNNVEPLLPPPKFFNS